MSAGECDGEITSPAKLLRYLYQRALISADVFGQSTLRRVTTKQRRRAALGRQLFQLIVADGAGVGQVEDPDFILLAQAPGTLAGLSQQDQVLRHLEPDYAIDNLEVKPLGNLPIADHDNSVSTPDGSRDGILAVFGIDIFG